MTWLHLNIVLPSLPRVMIFSATAFTVEEEAQPKRSLGEASCCRERRSPWLGNPVRRSIADKW